MPSQEEYEATLAEELEVLESIYIDELEKISTEQLRIRIEPEEDVLPLLFSIGLEPGQTPTESVEEGSPSPIVLSLDIQYTTEYPDAPPNMSIRVLRDTKGVLGPATDDDDDDSEDAACSDRPAVTELQAGLDEVAQESLGMAMVFTLASHLRESVTTLIQQRVQEIESAASAKREAEIEAEAEKFRGTAVTPEKFAEWRVKFLQEMAEKDKKEEDAKLLKLSAREREEYKKSKVKPSGKQLFEKGGTLDDDDAAEEGAQEVDWSLYTREQREKERREQEEQDELRSRTDGLAFDDDDDA
ncbi:RWD domain protein [Kalmanozyma brasiliensis GHG001]|uniref:RWD domain-containing protein n=1 Tax=Kalmanozyma brasiliensis (strain GHG001) TaxID=1365824 RepID=V5EBC5_KALBG|nr:RWD domain protein [Kalmanozyma brasiliensis GHG001]EST07696.1 RWD domain protein [Kalmanozyma brasiliensis GHG001]